MALHPQLPQLAGVFVGRHIVLAIHLRGFCPGIQVSGLMVTMVYLDVVLWFHLDGCVFRSQPRVAAVGHS